LVHGVAERSSVESLDLVLSDDLAEDVASAWAEPSDFEQLLADII
jgi:hypothetical protein